MTIVHNHQPQQFKNFSQFSDLADFNRQFEMLCADIKRVIPKRQYNFIIALKRFMASVPGISTAKYNTVVIAAKEKYDMPTSRRTAERIMPLLHRFDIVKMYDTKMKRTGIKGANIIVWQRYDAKKAAALVDFIKNGGTEKVEQSATNTDVARNEANEANSQNGGTLNGSSKASKINYYIRKGVAGFKSIAAKMTVKKDATISHDLQTQPVKPKEAFKPLKFISRLKDVVYRSKLNTKADVHAIKEIVFGNVYSVTKFKTMRPHTDSLLEKALRIVDACLSAHKDGQLTHIKSMRGFIDSRIKAELQAFCETIALSVEPLPAAETSAHIVETYGAALKESRTPAHLKGIGAAFDAWLRE